MENVPKAVVEGLEGSLNVLPVSDTINWTNNITYILQSKNKETGDPSDVIQVHAKQALSSRFIRMCRCSRRHRLQPAAAEEIQLQG